MQMDLQHSGVIVARALEALSPSVVVSSPVRDIRQPSRFPIITDDLAGIIVTFS
jgi:hypothetical protein